MKYLNEDAISIPEIDRADFESCLSALQFYPKLAFQANLRSKIKGTKCERDINQRVVLANKRLEKRQ